MFNSLRENFQTIVSCTPKCLQVPEEDVFGRPETLIRAVIAFPRRFLAIHYPSVRLATMVAIAFVPKYDLRFAGSGMG